MHWPVCGVMVYDRIADIIRHRNFSMRVFYFNSMCDYINVWSFEKYWIKRSFIDRDFCIFIHLLHEDETTKIFYNYKKYAPTPNGQAYNGLMLRFFDLISIF